MSCILALAACNAADAADRDPRWPGRGEVLRNAAESPLDSLSRAALVDVQAEGVANQDLRVVREFGAEDDLMEPRVIAVAGDRIIVADPSADTLLVVFDKRDGKRLARIGRRGQGPGEFIDPRWIGPADAESRRFWVYDFQLRRLSLVDPDRKGNAAVVGSRNLNNGLSYLGLLVRGQEMIANGLFTDFTLARMDTTGRLRDRVALKAPFDAKEMPLPTGRRLLNRTYLASHPDGDRIALLYQWQNRLDVVGLASMRAVESKGPKETQAVFDVKADRFFWRDSVNTMAYTGVTASRFYVFGVFCGCRIQDSNTKRIHQWRWDGTFVRVLRMPAEPRAIVAADDHTLFAIVEEPEPHVVELHVP